MPRGPGPHPAVVLLQGSGPEDRLNSGYFAPIRDRLVRRGVAVLCYDRPGVGGSSGDWRSLSLHDRAGEALAALRFLCAQPGTDAGCVGLYGHSQGGWVAPLAATLSDDVRFVVTTSGPAVSPAEQGLHAVEQAVRADGWPDEAVGSAVELVRDLYQAARDGAAFEQVAPLLARAEGAPWAAAVRRAVPLPGPDDWALATRPDPVSGRTFLDHDPLPVLERVRCPILAIFGERDAAVAAPANAALSRAALARAGNRDATVLVFGRASHRIRVGQRFAPGFLPTVVDWILARRTGARTLS